MGLETGAPPSLAFPEGVFLCTDENGPCVKVIFHCKDTPSGVL